MQTALIKIIVGVAADDEYLLRVYYAKVSAQALKVLKNGHKYVCFP